MGENVEFHRLFWLFVLFRGRTFIKVGMAEIFHEEMEDKLKLEETSKETLRKTLQEEEAMRKRMCDYLL